MSESDGSFGPLHAYVLLADPSYLRESLTSYYDLVDRVVLSFDRRSTSWTGTPLAVEECLRISREIDTDGKFVEAPGDFFRPDHGPLENDTHQRQVALAQAELDAAWVLQLDTDEVMLNARAVHRSILAADASGADACDFPMRWLYSRVAPGSYLEACRKSGGYAASYPGPVAVRSGTELTLARQTGAVPYRCDFETSNTDPWRPPDAPVHQVVSPEDAILHFSWVRHPDVLRRKFHWSGHTEDMRPQKVFRRWSWRTHHPRLTVMQRPLRRNRQAFFRLSTIPEPPGGPPLRFDLDA